MSTKVDLTEPSRDNLVIRFEAVLVTGENSTKAEDESPPKVSASRPSVPRASRAAAPAAVLLAIPVARRASVPAGQNTSWDPTQKAPPASGSDKNKFMSARDSANWAESGKSHERPQLERRKSGVNWFRGE